MITATDKAVEQASLAPSEPARVIPQELLARMDVPGPRYTSYPTADRFVEAFGPEDYAQALRMRASGAGATGVVPLSIYLHIPFCESVCYYCACNTVITKHHDKAAAYLHALKLEADLNVAELGKGRAVAQLHLGGGSPTFLSDDELADLMQMLRERFALLPDAEVSIEVDPRTASPQRLQHLAQLGFNRLSFGVQDFDEDVQRAVHRVQPEQMVADLMAAARSQGFQSINLDLIYGLPRQTPTSLERTLQKVTALRPERIALYSYAHLPDRFKPQRRIPVEFLPSAAQRVRMLGLAIEHFMAQGYVYIGMDHFALPKDPLAQARRQGRLHRNFQGYSTWPDCDLLGLGLSAIGRIGATYSQNTKSLDAYYDALRRRQFPVERGLALTRDDLLRRAVIMAIMCQGRVEFESIELAYLVGMRQYFAKELEDLQPMVDEGLVEVDDESIRVTAQGWFFVRAVAMVFDKHLRADHTRARFSRVI